MQQPATRRRAIIRNGVMAGSVWETRMKMDEVKGGITVFNAAAGESRDDEEGLRVHRRLRRNQSDGVDAEKKKRKSWKQPEPQSSPIQLRKARSTEIGRRRGAEENGVLLICDGRGNEKEIGEEIGIEVEERRRSFDDKEMDLPVEKEKKEAEVKKIEDVQERQVSPPPVVVVEKKASYVEDLKAADPDPAAMSQEEEDDDDEEEILFETSSVNSNKMQHIVDLVMWRDISKTAFAFGFGTFFLVSSSYAKDLNFSLISVISYLGLLYLAVIFIIRSVLRRGEELVQIHGDDGRYLVGEEEAIWILRRILPYLNELLLRTRALFSGDPATTLKMAVFLFVMGRCGSSITIWTLAKLAFFGVFTVPKVLSSYSLQLGRYGKFWVERFRDGWESCTHKKAIVAAIFTLIWNLSSTIARIWAVFILVVALRLYQQCMTVAWDEEEIPIDQDQHHQHLHQQQQQQWRSVRRGPGLTKTKK